MDWNAHLIGCWFPCCQHLEHVLVWSVRFAAERLAATNGRTETLPIAYRVISFDPLLFRWTAAVPLSFLPEQLHFGNRFHSRKKQIQIVNSKPFIRETSVWNSQCIVKNFVHRTPSWQSFFFSTMRENSTRSSIEDNKRRAIKGMLVSE